MDGKSIVESWFRRDVAPSMVDMAKEIDAALAQARAEERGGGGVGC